MNEPFYTRGIILADFFQELVQGASLISRPARF